MPVFMLHAGLDLSRKRIDVCLLSDQGKLVGELAVVRHVGLSEGGRVRAVIESMTGARFVHDSPEQLGWDVLVADAQ